MARRPGTDVEFEASTPFGFRVRCTRAHWRMITTEKHPTLKGQETQVVRVLQFPEHVRRARTDAAVLLCYGRYETRWLCAVVRVVSDGAFLVTAYPTDAIKAGEIVWTVFE